MNKHFYSHIVETTSITLELSEMNMTNEERAHLLALAQSNIHHAVLDAILSELSEEDKKKFLKHLSEDDQEEIWEFLNGRIENIEGKIKKTAEDLKKELHEDIRKSKKE